MFKDDLKAFIENNPKLVQMKETSPGMFVLKYRKKVFYDDLWNDLLEECRGTVVDKDFNIIQRPFTKIYNYGIEVRAPKFDHSTMVKAYRKINGYMIAVTWHNQDMLVSTTGSTDNDFVTMARQLIESTNIKQVVSKYQSKTFMFEVVHENDPHIIVEDTGLYLLGHREKSWESSVSTDDIAIIAAEMGVRCPEEFNLTLGELIELTKTVKHEGFVFSDQHGITSKIKSPFYLVSKWVARNPNTSKILTPQFKQQVAEEYYPLIDHLRDNIEQYTELDEQSRLEYVRSFLTQPCS